MPAQGVGTEYRPRSMTFWPQWFILGWPVVLQSGRGRVSLLLGMVAPDCMLLTAMVYSFSIYPAWKRHSMGVLECTEGKKTQASPLGFIAGTFTETLFSCWFAKLVYQALQGPLRWRKNPPENEAKCRKKPEWWRDRRKRETWGTEWTERYHLILWICSSRI